MIGRALPALGWAALAGVVTVTLWRPLIPFDAWWYHLPFAARIWGIGVPADFVWDDEVAVRWLGVPKAWHVLLGLFWAATGALRMVAVPQLLLLLGFLWAVRRLLGVTVPLLAAGLLASPMLLLHVQSTYLDLPAGLCLAAGLLALLVAIDRARAGAIDAVAAGIAVAAIGLAGNIKYQGTIGAGLVLAIAGVLACALPGIAARRRAALLGVIAGAGLLAGASLGVNAKRLGQPLYPLEISAFGRVLLPGPEVPDHDADPPTYLLIGSREVSLPGPVNFVLSLTELDWTMRGVAPWYNLDAHTGRAPRRGAPSRTGGLGGAFVLVHLALLAAQFVGWRRLDPRQRLLAGGALALLVAVAFLPRAHELRYWLAVPLVLVAVNLRWLGLCGWPAVARAGLAGLLLLGVTLTALSPRSDLVARADISMAGLRAAVPAPIAAALARDGRFCDAADKELFRYSTVVTGEPGRLSRLAVDCR